MKTLFASFFGNSFRKASVLVAGVMVAGSLNAATPNVVNDSEKNTQTATAPKPMKAVVFRLENTMKFKAIVENPSGKELRVIIRNDNNDVIYEDQAGKTVTYMRNFDLSSLTDGEYKVEISSGKEFHRQVITVSTVTARVASVQE